MVLRELCFFVWCLSLILQPTLVQANSCVGKEVRKLPEGCTSIVSHQLIVSDVDVQDYLFIANKLRTVETINAGLVIKNIQVADMNLFPELKEVSNPDGHGIIFESNENLYKFSFPKLNRISAGENQVAMIDDKMFYRSFYTPETFESLFRLQWMVSQPTGPGTCKIIFKGVLPEETKEDRTILVAMIIISIFLALSSVFVGFSICKYYETKKNQPDEQEPSINPESLISSQKTPSSLTNTKEQTTSMSTNKSSATSV
ncbi:unnamed protein product [Caenorhabditis auriculariae]|uniref:Receptor L-domain domain-containing protein n=1 Tax=Caenorhabditis auriculariae TaxID=2777116 RepID=A0A8S1HRU2_9PELO|nr:unnamed protein product [Caenorhabditis auriculariae]